jgi:hypothetical protein
MKRMLAAALLLSLGALHAEAASAGDETRKPQERSPVYLYKGWPLKRPPRVALIRPAHAGDSITPAVFLTPLAFKPVALTAVPPRDGLVWEDSEVLDKGDDWTAFTIHCDTHGQRMFLEIEDGKVQADWAEVVFDNGDTQVVDFAEKVQVPGLYTLLDLKDGRKVNHARIVARARTDEARLTLRMAR